MIDLALVALTTMLLTTNQVLLKIWISKYSQYVLPLSSFRIAVVFKPELIFCALAFVLAGGIWVSLLRRLDFSLLYPMISMSYIFGLMASKIVFQEQISIMRWIGVAVIILGVILVSQS